MSAKDLIENWYWYMLGVVGICVAVSWLLQSFRFTRNLIIIGMVVGVSYVVYTAYTGSEPLLKELAQDTAVTLVNSTGKVIYSEDSKGNYKMVSGDIELAGVYGGTEATLKALGKTTTVTITPELRKTLEKRHKELGVIGK